MPSRAAHEHQTTGSTAFSRRFVAPLLLGSALNPVNSSLIATALVPIAHGLHIEVARTAILVSLLYLSCAVAQPTCGKLAEAIGPRRVFLGGIALVAVGGLLGGLGETLPKLAMARVLIGIGTSAGYPSAMVLIRRRARDNAMQDPPGTVLGALQIAATVTVGIALPVGGLIVQTFGWRAAFLVNLPLTVVAFACSIAWLPRDEPRGAGLSVRALAHEIDLTGVVLFAATLVALLSFLDALPALHWPLLGAAAVLLAVLVGWELRVAKPFVDVRLLVRTAALAANYLRIALLALCVYGVLYGLTQWLEIVHRLPPLQSGLVLLPMSASSILITRPIARRNLIRGPLITASVCALLGALGLLILTAHTSIVLIAAITLVFGVTLGTMSIGSQAAVYGLASAEQIGTAAGLLRTFLYLGSIGSAALTAVFYHARVDDHGLHQLGAVLLAVSALALVFTLADRRLPRTATHTPTSPSMRGTHATDHA